MKYLSEIIYVHLNHFWYGSQH